MEIEYHSSLVSYVDSGKLPLWVAYVARGKHPERRFHDHAYFEIAVVMHGSARHLADGGSAMIKTGDVLVIHPGTIHAYDHTGDLELINIVYDYRKLSLPWLDGYSLPLFKTFFPNPPENRIGHPAEPVMNIKPEELDGVIAMIRRLENELHGITPGNLFYSLALFMELVVTLSRLSGCEQPEQRVRFMIGDAIGFMNRNFTRPISVDELVKTARMSRRNFFRLFQQTVGCSPIEYLIKIRLHHAAAMLLHTDYRIGEIAQNCGFSDSNYFGQKFRAQYQATPRQFRLRQNNPDSHDGE